MWRADCSAEAAVLGSCRGRGAAGLSRCRDGAGGASSPRTGGAAPAADQGLRAACAPRADAGGGSTLVDGQLSCQCEFCSANTYTDSSSQHIVHHRPPSGGQSCRVWFSITPLMSLICGLYVGHGTPPLRQQSPLPPWQGQWLRPRQRVKLLKKSTANGHRVCAHCGFGCLTVDHG